MGRYRSILKCAEIRRLVDEGKYSKALEILELIDPNQVKVITDLNAIAEVYMKAERYEETKQILLRIYEKSRTRRVLYQLVYVFTQIGEIEEAEEYYKEYAAIDPDGSDRLILRYQIDKAKGVGRDKLILLLEQLKQIEYREEWAYELAKMYHKEGRKKDCVRECSDIILWFGEGVIVEKANLLKLHYENGLDFLTPYSFENVKLPVVQKDNIQQEDKNVGEEAAEKLEKTDEILEENVFEDIDRAFEDPEIELKRSNFVIIGKDHEIILKEAKRLAKQLSMSRMILSNKVAKISAEKLNSIKLEKSQEKLRNSFLFIDHAGELSIESIHSLIKMMELYESQIVVILGDEEEGIEWLFKKSKKFKAFFKYNLYV